MYNNTNANTNPAIIDINDKERLKRITISDLYNDAEAREDEEALDLVSDWFNNHKEDKNSPAYMKFKHDYLVKYCGLPLSAKENHAITAAKIAARAAKKAAEARAAAIAEAIKEENNIEK